jgi:chorismate mutase-like protein
MTEQEALELLAHFRVKIDEIDLRLVALLNERTRVVEKIGAVKEQSSLPVYEPRREDAVFQNVQDHNSGPLPNDSGRRIFERIIDEMRTIQKLRMKR